MSADRFSFDGTLAGVGTVQQGDIESRRQVDAGGPDELTLELADPVPEGQTVRAVYSPSE